METHAIMIHVRFSPDGTVTEIGERPQGVPAQAWFNHLSRNTQNCYETLWGGRGIFRFTREQVDALKQSCQAEVAA
jgi:hypothetical protein